MYPYTGDSGSLQKGNNYVINLIGVCKPNRLYGYVDGVLVILYNPGGELGRQLYNTGVGRTVRAKIKDITKMGVFADYIKDLGTFRGREIAVEVTAQSFLDARDCMSTTAGGGGLFGVTAVVKRYKPVTECYPDKPRLCKVRVKCVTRGKKWKPLILTTLQESTMERDIVREIYVLEWPPDMKYPLPYAKPTGKKLPRFSSLKEWKIGIPTDTRKVLLLGDRENVILDEDKNHEFIGRVAPVKAVGHFYDSFLDGKFGGGNDGGREFKLALAPPGRIEELRGAIDELGLYAEDLALRK